MSRRTETGPANIQPFGGQRLRNTGIFLLDNLPRIDRGLTPVIVPWLGAEYDGKSGDFLKYPEQWGFSLELLLQGQFGHHGPEQGLAFIQAWLFFGLLKEALGDQIDLSYEDWIADYRTPQATKKRMISAHMTTYLMKISHKLRDPRQYRQSWQYWEEVFALTIAVAEAFDLSFARTCSADDVDQHEPLHITWSILMLGQILTNTIMECYRVEESRVKSWPDGTILHLRMSRQLECPHQRNKVMALFTMDAIYPLTLLPSHSSINRNSSLSTVATTSTVSSLSLYDEDPAVGRGRHRYCTIQRCLGQNIDEASYRTEHVNNECNCAFDGPDVREVIQILDDTEVPAFVIREHASLTGPSRLSIDVVRSKDVSGYVAISHVWADGLGNKAENTLPRCQITRLARLVSTLTGREAQAFWIDTFGIPRDLEQRRKALAVMNPTYRLAEMVLVLDGGLQQHTSHPAVGIQVADVNTEAAKEARVAIALELLLRIVCCSWTSRLWTLPEGMLGPELHFQFSDGTVELGDLLAQLRSWRFIGTSVVQDITSALIRLRPKLRTQERCGLAPLDPLMQKWPHGDLYGQFITMLHALEFRNTTWKEDEATCLAIHLGLNLQKIVSRDQTERLEAFFAQMDLIPADLMFTHGERIAHYPYRWAPLHLLEYKDNYICIPAATPERLCGVRTDLGLLVQVDGYKLHTRNERVPNTDLIYFSIQATSEDGVKYPINYCMQPAALDPRTAPSWRRCKTNLVLEAGGPAAEFLYVILGPGGVQGPPATTEPGRVGLIVCKSSEQDGCLYANPVDTVAIFEIPGSRTVRPDHVNTETFVHWHAEEMLGETFCVG